MGELVKLIAKSLVDSPELVEVNEVENKNSLVIELKVDSNDMGKVIGKQGRIAKAIRTLVKAAATKENKKVIVEIMQ
ncbi:MAG: KH domain-containing protein [Peptostreptococcaceae bacterium]|nr:KH domain-containing protein [Peptostreptococcaceae bacterium]